MKFPSIFVLSTTGKKVLVRSKQDYKRGYHLPVEADPVVEPVVEKAEEEEESAQAVVGDEKAEWDELVAIGWAKLSSDQRARYQELKPNYA